MKEWLGYLKLSPLFQSLDEALLEHLVERAQWTELPSGKYLFSYGDPGDALYVVVAGRLRVSVPTPKGERLIADVGRGEVIGEIAVVTGDPRSGSVRAIRDSALLRIAKDDFDSLLNQHPSSMMGLARLIVQRLQQHTRNRARDAMLSTRTIAIASAHYPALPLTDLTGHLADALSSGGLTMRVDSATVDAELGEGTAQSVFDESAGNQRLLNWLNDREASHRYLVYQADLDASAWTARCLRQADRILLVVDAVRQPMAGPVVDFIKENGMQTPVELVFVHQGRRALQCDPASWRTLCNASAHHHIITGDSRHLARLGRLVTGRALGVAFSGGGARGFAHLGLIRALAERDMHVDLTGGTSMGALIGSLLAMGYKLDDMQRVLRDIFIDHNNLNDYTLPRVSLIRGRKLRRKLEEIFGKTRIEDMDLPYFCVSANLTRGKQMIHDQGKLQDWVSASMAVPGIAPPVVFEGDVLVDGGILNNLPTDVMQNMGRGQVIGSDVSSAQELRVNGVDTSEPQDMLNILDAAKEFSLATILVRTATLVDEEQIRLRAANSDLYLRMPVQGIGMFDWKMMDALIDRGYQCANEALDLYQQPPVPSETKPVPT